MQGIMALCAALSAVRSGPVPPTPLTLSSMPSTFSVASVALQQGGWPLGSVVVLDNVDRTDLVVESCFATWAEQVDEEVAKDDCLDILDDEVVCQYLRDGVMPTGLTPKEVRRVKKRGKLYSCEAGIVSKVMADGSSRVVPAKVAREQIVLRVHEQNGHFGTRRTLSLVLTSYWWRGMKDDVRRVIGQCQHCSRAKAYNSAKSPELHSLPIRGLMYRWGVDLAGPIKPESDRGHEYFMVAIEHFSKWLVVVPIPDKTADTVAYAFLHHVLARFGACAEVVTYNGSEFQGAFAELLLKSYIDHRTTSPQHPQADGLAERAVQTVKAALRKFASQGHRREDWDKDVAWVALGYNCSVQESTKFSPYQLIYGMAPVVPPAIKQRLEGELPDLSDSTYPWEAVLADRASAMQQNLVIAGSNLLTAQHRDQRRYALVRGGSYAPAPELYHVGDFVYVRKTDKGTTLDMDAYPHILRVSEVLDSGVLVLQGGCGGVIKMHRDKVSKCHLQGLDPTVNPTLFRPAKEHPCQVCRSSDDHRSILLCGKCNEGYHLQCLRPPLTSIPDGDWFCPKCVAAGSSSRGGTVPMP